MNLFELAAVISLDSSAFHNGLSSASGEARSFGENIKSAFSAVSQAATVAFSVASAAVTAFGASAVDVGKQFDASMANVASISGAVGADFDKLREKAIEMGGKTKFSATEAADAMSYMAMAGWKTGDMLDGIGGIMDLAAASGEGLAKVADIVTDGLTAFGLSASDSGHFADVLAVAASNANTNVSMMGETFKYVAPLAGTLKMTAEDVAEAVGLMANSGIKAGQAGTALRAALTRLAKPTSDMIPIMEQLGLAVFEISAEEAKAQTEALEQSLKAKKKAYADDEDALRESLDRQYDALKKSLDARYDAQKEAFDDEYEARKSALDASYDSAKDTYDKEYEARKKALDAAYDALEKSLDAEMDAFQRLQEEELEAVQKSQDEQVKQYEKAAEDKIAAIDAVYKESLKNTDENEYKRLQQLDAEIAKIQAESDKAAKEAEENERKQRRAELQKAIDAAKTAEARMEAEQKLADYNEKIRQKDAEAVRKAQIADLKAKKDAAKEEAKAAREAAKEARDAEIESAKERGKAEMDELKERQKEELKEFKRAQKDALEAKKEARKEQLDAAKEANADDLKELKKNNDKLLEDIKKRNESELKGLKKAQSDQLAAVKDGNDETLKEVKKGYEKQLEALKESNKDKLSEYQDYVTEQKKAIKEASKSAQSLIMTDENGNMRELINNDKEHLGVINLLKEAFAGLSEAEQVEAAATLFGQEAMSGMLAVLNAAPNDVEKLESALRDCEGAAAEMAATHENSLAGSITTLGSAMETLKIRISDALTPTLRQSASI